MKAEELMVGDWVRILDDDTDQSFETRITGVSELGNIYAPLPEGEHAYPFSVDCIEPIPLTPEILEKNGFDVSDPEVAQYHFSEGGERYHFSLRRMYKKGKPDGWAFFAFNVLSLVVYVHELQHALRLCGINKEIEL